MKCNKFHDVNYVVKANGVPKCQCGGIVKPDVVLYEESLNSDIMEKSVRFIEKADVLIIGGTSVVVYPAAGLRDYFKGSKLVLINKTSTPMDKKADFIIYDSIGKVFED